MKEIVSVLYALVLEEDCCNFEGNMMDFSQKNTSAIKARLPTVLSSFTKISHNGQKLLFLNI